MAPISTSLRNVWSRMQPSAISVPQPIADFDGISDGIEHMLEGSRESCDNDPVLTKGLTTSTSRPYHSVTENHLQYAGTSQQSGKQPLQFAVSQNAPGHDLSKKTNRSETQPENGGQNYDPTQQVAVNALDAGGRHLEDTDRVHPFHPSATANEESPRKVEKANTEHNDDDLFAEFTNEDYHDGDAESDATTRQTSHEAGISAAQTSIDAPSMDQEHGSEPLAAVATAEPAKSVKSTVAPSSGVVSAPTTSGNPADATVASLQGHYNTESDLSTPTIPPSVQGDSNAVAQVDVSSQGSSSADTIYASSTQHSAEQYAQDPYGQAISFQTRSGTENSQRSPSADSVITLNRHGSKEASATRAGMNLNANTHLLAQQWSQRQELVDMSTLTAEAVQLNPVLHHGPMPTRQQHGQNALNRQHTVTQIPHRTSLSYAQHRNGPQGSPNFSYHGNMQHQVFPPSTQIHYAYSQSKPSGMIPNGMPPHEALLGYNSLQNRNKAGLANPRDLSGVIEEGVSEASDDEPLATRAPRYGSTTSSPIASVSVLPHQVVETPPNASKDHVSNTKQDSAVELIESGGDVEPISWKLPSFEAIYHAPTKTDETPTAKISIPSLVREEVALTEDHATQEMQLFLDVFLPAQRALQTPDPQPAHAVLNFHTIAVMVLEAFVQWEIGDELGRGYGFHSGEFVRRPSPTAASDAEPQRTRAARDADVDEIFFAVVDRWRAAMLAGKATAKLVRGCQEFCDVALDVIHHVKQHGLLQPEPKTRRVRSDKGVPRGPRGAKQTETETETATKGKEGKRKADAMTGKTSTKSSTTVTELQVRKKTKTEQKTTQPKSKPKPKASTGKPSGVVVVKPRKK